MGGCYCMLLCVWLIRKVEQLVWFRVLGWNLEVVSSKPNPQVIEKSISHLWNLLVCILYILESNPQVVEVSTSHLWNLLVHILFSRAKTIGCGKMHWSFGVSRRHS